MALSSPIKLWDSDKLRILQRLDKHRQWRSLDEKRYCLVCGKLITGRDIEVIGGFGAETVRIVCPTRDCHSIPMDWVLPTDEVLSHTARSTTQSSVTTHFELRQENAIAARMRKWTMRFKWAGK